MKLEDLAKLCKISVDQARRMMDENEVVDLNLNERNQGEQKDSFKMDLM